VQALTPKQRMLRAYRGQPVDRPPVAPEFWYYYPARVLGVDMIAFEREVPLWEALLATFQRYGSEGWGAAFAEVLDAERVVSSRMERMEEGRYRETRTMCFRGRELVSQRMYSREEPSSVERYPVQRPEELAAYVEMQLSEAGRFSFEEAVTAHSRVGESYLLELWLGLPFFDFIAEGMGFEPALLYFLSGNDEQLHAWRERYIEQGRRLVEWASEATPFESFVIGCSSSCNSLLGPRLWRRWDKPYLRAMSEEVHRRGRLLHLHFHGRCLETVADFAELGLDCVCPFERPPGGDVEGEGGLRRVRELLAERVTMNGNVHTVDTLIRGSPEQVRGEVQEIRRAFAGSRRFIIGTGDQVGKETPEQNILAMLEEGREG
jgi:hypothetical protein